MATPPPDEEHAHLDGLDQRFLAALGARQKGDVDTAAELLRGILKAEPRLAEPHMELASLLLDAGQVDEAREHADEAVRLLEGGPPWLEDPPHHVLQSLAWNLLGEALRQKADSDEVVFGDPADFRRLMGESRSAFAKAAALDPNNGHADHWSFNLKLVDEEDDNTELDAFDVFDVTGERSES